MSSVGTYYVYGLLEEYSGNYQEVYVAWMMLCLINSYNLFTLYYESLLLGKGLVKKSKQILIVGQVVYLLVAALFIIFGYGLIAIVTAQLLSVVIVRFLSYCSFFTVEIKISLKNAMAIPTKEILKAIYPNAFKIGLTTLGGLLVTRSAILIGSLYLPLSDIASYGVTMQLISVITGLAMIYLSTFQPKITQLFTTNNIQIIKGYYLKSQIFLFFTYFGCGLVLVIFGNVAFNLIGSQTQLISPLLIFVAVLVSYLESNHTIAAMILVSRNEIPFYKASLLSGAATLLLLILLFNFTEYGLWIMIVAPGLAQGFYQNWKWPCVVRDLLKIGKRDFSNAFVQVLKFDFM
jgi:O-antigen/teichoic acid export membrane protein